MKNTILTILTFCLFIGITNAQIVTPAASPTQEIEQSIGLTDVTLVYSRPGKKGRTIFGADGIVEYGKLWRTGANAATKITFSTDVTVNGTSLKGGDYAISICARCKILEVNFYPYESSSWGSYTEKTPSASVEAVPSMNSREIETFQINFTDFSDEGATMELAWGKTIVPVSIGVETDKTVMESIDNVMAGPTNNDYYNAASYFHSSGKDLNQALEWIQRVTSVDSPKFWQVRKEALILGDLGRYKEAIVAAKKSKDLAATAGNDEYVKMNDKSIAEWMMKK